MKPRAPSACTLATVLAVAGLLAVVGLVPAREGVPAPFRTSLERVLGFGPAPGRWRIEDGWGIRVRALAPIPGDAGRMLVGQVGGGPKDKSASTTDPRTAEAKRVRTFPLARLGVYASAAPAGAFFRNYAPAGAPVADVAEGGVRALRVDWKPRQDPGGDTQRRVWHDPTSYEVIQIEDRSYHGRVVHGLYRISREPGPMSAPVAGPAGWPWGGGGGGGGPARPEGAAPWKPRPAASAPFPVLAPTYLPPGFEPAFSGYQEWPMPPRGPVGEGPSGSGTGKPEWRRMRVATLTYSDGLGFLAVTVAPREDLDAIEAFTARQEERRQGPEGCGSLPESSGDVADGGLLIRRRADLCRTVLRVDDVEGVSVLVLGRNEVAGDEYLKVVRSLAPLPEGVSGKK